MTADEQEYWDEVNAEMRKPLPTDPPDEAYLNIDEDQNVQY